MDDTPARATMPSLAHLSASDFLHVYEPQEDTWLLCDTLLAERRLLRASRPAVAVEIGPGSGSVATFLAQLLLSAPPAAAAGERAAPPFVLACDLNPKACEATRATARANGVGALVDAVRCDLLGPVAARLEGAVDVLLFNPPYVPSDSDEVPLPYNRAAAPRSSDDGAPSDDDPDLQPARQRKLAGGAWAGGEGGREVLDRLLPLLHRMLARPSGLLYLVALEENRPVDIAQSLAAHGLVTQRVGFTKAVNERLHVLRVAWRDNPLLRLQPAAGAIDATAALGESANSTLAFPWMCGGETARWRSNI